MAYTPKEWECGEVVTAEALNHIEQGILGASSSGASSLVIKAASIEKGDTAYVYTDKTFNEVADAMRNGTPCYVGFEANAVCSATSADDLNQLLLMLPVLEADTSSMEICYFDTNTANRSYLQTTADGVLFAGATCSST